MIMSSGNSAIGESQSEPNDHHPPRRLWGLAGPLVIILIGLALYLPGSGWGLPGTVSWSQDTIAGVRTLGAVEGWPTDWKGRYPPLQYLILAGTYQPILEYWERTGERVIDPATGSVAFQPPEAPKIGLLIGVARAVSVVMAIAAGLGLWVAARVLTGDKLAAVLAAVALMIGAAYTYFAHLGNVDIPAMCWFTWSLFFFARLLQRGRWTDAVWLGLFGALAISTKDALAGMYPGMAVVLLAAETRGRMKAVRLRSAFFGALFQAKWLAGLAAFVLPYLLLYGVWADPEAYFERMKYWLAPTADTLHARQQRYPDQTRLLAATMHYAAAAVGWPMLAAMIASLVYAWHKRLRIALIVITPSIGYYLMVLTPIGFVYSRFLFASIALLCIPVGLAGAALWRQRAWPIEVRLGVPGVVLLLSFGYTVAVDAEMLTDSRYQAERWFAEQVPPPASVGAFSDPQYLPRLHEQGYATYQVRMARESFDRPQPEYLVLSSYDYENYDEAQRACQEDLLTGRLGYTPVVAFDRRYLGTGSCWLSLGGWGTPVPGKISPKIIVLRRAGG